MKIKNKGGLCDKWERSSHNEEDRFENKTLLLYPLARPRLVIKNANMDWDGKIENSDTLSQLSFIGEYCLGISILQ